MKAGKAQRACVSSMLPGQHEEKQRGTSRHKDRNVQSRRAMRSWPCSPSSADEDPQGQAALIGAPSTFDLPIGTWFEICAPKSESDTAALLADCQPSKGT